MPLQHEFAAWHSGMSLPRMSLPHSIHRDTLFTCTPPAVRAKCVHTQRWRREEQVNMAIRRSSRRQGKMTAGERREWLQQDEWLQQEQRVQQDQWVYQYQWVERSWRESGRLSMRPAWAWPKKASRMRRTCTKRLPRGMLKGFRVSAALLERQSRESLPP